MNARPKRRARYRSLLSHAKVRQGIKAAALRSASRQCVLPNSASGAAPGRSGRIEPSPLRRPANGGPAGLLELPARQTNAEEMDQLSRPARAASPLSFLRTRQRILARYHPLVIYT